MGRRRLRFTHLFACLPPGHVTQQQVCSVPSLHSSVRIRYRRQRTNTSTTWQPGRPQRSPANTQLRVTSFGLT
ncbi:hypothetical protein LZ31DRAFT_46847 [Colletotrichum somersetense]|nr:hypothetical protein LZ31DRAFT_46847 [Colletotrichum somersetense]